MNSQVAPPRSSIAQRTRVRAAAMNQVCWECGLPRPNACASQDFHRYRELGGKNVIRIVLNPTGVGKSLFEFVLRLGYVVALLIEQNRS